jgi:hypothetical protein
VDALAERGGLTRDQAATRLTQGEEKYRELLDVGQATIARALNTARRALPEGPGRTAIRHALDDLTNRHQPPAVAEYIAPASDPGAAGIDGFRPQDT